MTPLVFLVLSAAGGVGAAARFLLDGVIRTRAARLAYPLGTTVINVTGSLALGVVAGAAIAGALPNAWQLVVGTGFLGGYTTFSTASFETVRLVQERRLGLGLVNALGVLVAATGAATGGLFVGLLL